MCLLFSLISRSPTDVQSERMESRCRLCMRPINRDLKRETADLEIPIYCPRLCTRLLVKTSLMIAVQRRSAAVEAAVWETVLNDVPGLCFIRQRGFRLVDESLEINLSASP